MANTIGCNIVNISPSTYPGVYPAIWEGLVTQVALAAPVPVIHFNGLGETLIFARVSDGEFTITSPGGLFTTKTHIQATESTNDRLMELTVVSPTTISLLVFESLSAAANNFSGFISIKIWP